MRSPNVSGLGWSRAPEPHGIPKIPSFSGALFRPVFRQSSRRPVGCRLSVELRVQRSENAYGFGTAAPCRAASLRRSARQSRWLPVTCQQRAGVRRGRVRCRAPARVGMGRRTAGSAQRLPPQDQGENAGHDCAGTPAAGPGFRCRAGAAGWQCHKRWFHEMDREAGNIPNSANLRLKNRHHRHRRV